MKVKNLENIIKNEKGVALYLAVIIASILLAIGLGLNSILIGQLKVTKAIGDSVIAFYAADTGIEEVLMGRQNPSSSCTKTVPCNLDNEAQYYVIITLPGADCEAANYCIKSVGQYKGIKRAIEIKY